MFPLICMSSGAIPGTAQVHRCTCAVIAEGSSRRCFSKYRTGCCTCTCVPKFDFPVLVLCGVAWLCGVAVWCGYVAWLCGVALCGVAVRRWRAAGNTSQAERILGTVTAAASFNPPARKLSASSASLVPKGLAQGLGLRTQRYAACGLLHGIRFRVRFCAPQRGVLTLWWCCRTYPRGSSRKRTGLLVCRVTMAWVCGCRRSVCAKRSIRAVHQ